MSLSKNGNGPPGRRRRQLPEPEAEKDAGLDPAVGVPRAVGTALGGTHRSGVERRLELDKRGARRRLLPPAPAAAYRSILSRSAARPQTPADTRGLERRESAARRRLAGETSGSRSTSRIRPIRLSAALTGSGLVSRKLASMSGSSAVVARRAPVEVAGERQPDQLRHRFRRLVRGHGNEPVATHGDERQREPVVAREHREASGRPARIVHDLSQVAARLLDPHDVRMLGEAERDGGGEIHRCPAGHVVEADGRVDASAMAMKWRKRPSCVGRL